MAVNDLVDSFFHNQEKCGTERVTDDALWLRRQKRVVGQREV